MRFFSVSANILMCLDEGVSDSVCSAQVAFRRNALLQNDKLEFRVAKILQENSPCNGWVNQGICW
jgi:hypothetical protein